MSIPLISIVRRAWLMLCLSGTLGAAEAPAAREFTAAERLQRDQLARTHEAVATLAQTRTNLPPLTGHHDFRAIFHAHADDSAHTGGTAPELLADAQRAGVHAVFLSDHHRPPRDFMNSWRGLHDGVLFVPGSEARG